MDPEREQGQTPDKEVDRREHQAAVNKAAVAVLNNTAGFKHFMCFGLRHLPQCC